ncbi:MAG TPA: ACT domain-containing protein [Holophagaceae bacterium]|nr:ACT domain-containing protein [Holophagaceae bacterium]
MKLRRRPEVLAVARLEATAPWPAWALEAPFAALTRTDEELSLVVPLDRVPEGVRREGPWRAVQVEGPLDFALVGILAELSGILARAGISCFALSTFDTDYLLVKSDRLEAACEALGAAGHAILGA